MTPENMQIKLQEGIDDFETWHLSPAGPDKEEIERARTFAQLVTAWALVDLVRRGITTFDGNEV